MATITEDYVSFEIAKLLKEKGFNEKCTHYYKNKKYLVDLGYTNIHSYTNSDLVEEFAAPTLQMVMKWLREVHNLVIQIEFIDFLEHGEVWLYLIIERKTIKQLTDRDEDFTEHSYEEACEAAIRFCCKNLI